MTTMRDVLVVDERDVAVGQIYGYPTCCIEWFTYVWAPVWDYLMRTGADRDAVREAAFRLRGPMQPGCYVQCPSCRRVRRTALTHRDLIEES